ncbi:rhamnosidase [bacterium]|nr:MAG: rhamnosidase [bacterium]
MVLLSLGAAVPLSVPSFPLAEVEERGSLVPYALRCESLSDPEGVGRARPELSWKLRAAKSSLENLRQTAYEVRVGTTAGRGDLWNSGRVASSAQYGVEFGGEPLRSGQVAFWSVRTWDATGGVSAWSAPAKFSVGLLSEGDWKAQWIGWDAPTDSESGGKRFAGASWIWTEEADPLRIPKQTRSFERRFTLANTPTSAKLTLTADDRFTLFVNGQEVSRTEPVTDGWRNAVTLDLASHLRAGENTLRIEAENTSTSPAGVIARLVVEGEPTLVTDGEWTSEGKTVKAIASYGGGPWGRFADERIFPPTTLFSTGLRLDRKLVRAMAHVTALGLVDLSINGKRVSQDLFTPGWTNYKKRVYARTYDVTKALRAGENALALELGDGWYSGYVGYSRERSHYGDRPRVRAQVELEYADGTRQTVGTDRNWRAGTGGTIAQDFLIGEEFVAGISPSQVGRPYVVEDISAKVEPFPGSPVLAYDRLKPVKITAQGDGYILDYGQNLAGFAHVKARGKPGQRIQMQFVEVLNPDGTLYTANLRSARAIDAYTFGGTGVEEWEPRFTFHGFRYMKVTGLGRKPKPEEFTAVAISSGTPETGTFTCSDPMLNKLAKNAWWTQKMNFIDVPTDCPQRDERLGWTGDAQAYVRTAATYSDVQPFFRKWLVALDDDQREDGQYPKIAPQIMNEADGGPAWSDAGVICPWTVYGVYGDQRLLAEHYPGMRRFVEFTLARSTPDLLPPKDFHCFGDWLSINADTPNEVIYEAYFAYTTELLAKAAQTLGKTEDAQKYRDLHARIKEAFTKAYVSADGTVKGDTQTAYVLALGFNLIPTEELRTKAADKLVGNIEARGGHLSTGFVGTRDLMRVLSEIGRNDVAFRLLHNTTFPSWGFEIKNGATTVWERWDGWTPERGFQDPGMNSFSHYAYGAVMGWVFQTVGGIDNAAPGFERIVIAPKIDPKLTWAKTSFESVRRHLDV